MLRRDRRKYYLVYLLVFGLIATVYFLQYSKDSTHKRFYLEMVNKRNFAIGRYIDRANHVRKTCKYLQDRVPKIQYYDLESMQQIYNMGGTLICVVPKSGCSFLKRLVYYLSDPRTLLEAESLTTLKQHEKLDYIHSLQRQVFNLTRFEIHFRLDYRPTKISEQKFAESDYKKVVVARNPYSRLFSAYIDKVFIPVLKRPVEVKYMHIRKKWVTAEKICSEYISFQDFLEVVIWESQHSLGNQHWLPASVLCNTCSVNPDIVIKQETYHEDIAFLLSQIDINESQWTTIDSVIAKQGIQTDSILNGLIRTMYYKGLESEIDCFSKIEIARRVWEALKTQGQIYEYLEFPKEQLLSTTLSVSKVTEVFLAEIKQVPISPEESRNQRHRALINAYKHIPHDILLQLQGLFYYDFMIFQYDFDPPK